MKTLILLLFIVLVSCTKNERIATDKEAPFKKLPFDLSTNFRDSIAKQIIPNKNYKYWAYCSLRDGYSEKSRIIIKQGGDTLFKFKADPNTAIHGFYQGGHPGYSANYLLVNDNGKKEVLETEDGLRKFLGPIDNLEEAVLLALSYGYVLDTDIKGNAYRIKDGNYEMHLLKYNDYPFRKESVEVIVNKEGFIKTQSLDIYCKKWDDCPD